MAQTLPGPVSKQTASADSGKSATPYRQGIPVDDVDPVLLVVAVEEVEDVDEVDEVELMLVVDDGKGVEICKSAALLDDSRPAELDAVGC